MLMAIAGSQRSERSLHLSQIERIENSHTLHSSESLRRLFRYLADHALEHPGSPLKEYQIATEVFGRPPDFDPQLDSTIRVQAGRLRGKLAEYYASEGAEDPILIELPKGGYVLSFQPRPPEVSKPSGPELVPAARATATGFSRLRMAVLALALLLLAAIAVIASLLAARRSSVVASAGATVPAVYATFWEPFIAGKEEPWVVFSNAAFVGRPETGIRYFDAARDKTPQVILDHYTGVGEVLAVHNLDLVFNRLRRPIRVKRGSLFSLDDAKNNDLIFVGSPAENLTLLDIPSTSQFIFQRVAFGERKGDLAIVNVHPREGEPKDFRGSPATEPLNEDYAIIALVRGMDPSHSVLILAGTTTMGTQAAVEFVCGETSLRQLLQRLNVADYGEIKPFEAVVRVKVARGVPVETTIAAVRTGK